MAYQSTSLTRIHSGPSRALVKETLNAPIPISDVRILVDVPGIHRAGDRPPVGRPPPAPQGKADLLPQRRHLDRGLDLARLRLQLRAEPVRVARYAPAIGRQLSLEFLAGYVVEESLSIDNMFVFALVFRYFAVPSRYQHKVLFYGVLGAMIFRAIFIAAGSALVRFEWVMIVFGLFLIFTGVRMALSKDENINPGDSMIIRWVRRFMPITPEYHGARFLVTIDGSPPHHAAHGRAALPRDYRPALRG